MRAGKLAREDVQQNLRVRLGVHVAQIVAKHLPAERLGIDQVAVVRERDPVGGIDVEGLCLLRRVASRGRIADMPDAHASAQRLHVAALEDISHQPVGLALVDLEIAGGDPRRVLTAVLERGERVVQILIDVCPTDDSDVPVWRDGRLPRRPEAFPGREASSPTARDDTESGAARESRPVHASQDSGSTSSCRPGSKSSSRWTSRGR